MRIKRSIKDEFEKVYLRYNQVKRDLPKAKLNEFKNPHFIKSCKYTASLCFYGNEEFLLNNGFDYDDIHSMSVIFGGCFLGYKDKSEAYDEKRYYLMMINYIIQRLNRFIYWTSKKMQSDEIVGRSSIDNPDEYFSVDPAIIIDGVAMWGDTENNEPEVSLGDLYVSLDSLKEKRKETKNLAKKRKIASEEGQVKDRIKLIKKKDIEKRKERKITLDKMKTEINLNPNKYEEKLVYYACTKHVSDEMRRAARKYCDKLGIDYKTKAKEFNDTKNYIIKG